ncbi:hypothetical protein [Endozoicomonas sp. SCSIO W0465]|uniref:hypothetical protein n=1 Tax=Endozoicomonas sp. SCSIO W0465 TaxID=2918516 RepID=UPI002074F9DB|nr:hypothetical protein [Endozoicomonas sp. SCSIO W0465]USE36822.1 hypothetical protein MJO57_00845 [Endozoicomonas sp. SCSIO W0465]
MEKQFTDFGLLHYKKLTELSFYTDSKVEHLKRGNNYSSFFPQQWWELAVWVFCTAPLLNAGRENIRNTLLRW